MGKRVRWRLVVVAILMCAVSVGAQGASVAALTAAAKHAGNLPGGIMGNWLSYNGDYSGRRYSGLVQITPGNVHQLRAAWVFHTHNAGVLEVTPVVRNGIMYITASNDAYALDAADGLMLWHHSRPISAGLIDDASNHINRGVGLWGNRLYMETDNAHLLCLDARSGHLIWDVAYAPQDTNYGATSAPLVIHGKVLVGTSGGDDGVRGFLAAYDAITGKQIWRRWTIPGPGEFGSSSWPGDSYLHGGGTTWMPGTYDPELNTLYWGTSNPSPDFDGDGRPGDDLYTASVLALDPDTGKLKWYFQFTPHDLGDYDGVETPVLIDRIYQGRLRKLLIEANRNGFVYILDRVTGKFLSATKFVKGLNWASGIDPSGRPILTNVKPSANGTLVCPGINGATNWYAPSYSEATGLFYFIALNQCTVNYKKPENFAVGREYYASNSRRDPFHKGQKVLMAFNPATHQFAWEYPQIGNTHSWAGVLTTKTGLVFFGDDATSLEAVDASTGKSLWHFRTGQNIHASPMTYSVDGKQYVAIASGDDLFAFTLP